MPATTTATKMTMKEIDLHLAVISASKDLPTPIAGRSCEELARMVGCSPAAIHRRTTAAMLAVKTKLPADILESRRSN